MIATATRNDAAAAIGSGGDGDDEGGGIREEGERREEEEGGGRIGVRSGGRDEGRPTVQGEGRCWCRGPSRTSSCTVNGATLFCGHTIPLNWEPPPRMSGANHTSPRYPRCSSLPLFPVINLSVAAAGWLARSPLHPPPPYWPRSGKTRSPTERAPVVSGPSECGGVHRVPAAPSRQRRRSC